VDWAVAKDLFEKNAKEDEEKQESGEGMYMCMVDNEDFCFILPCLKTWQDFLTRYVVC
jgi:hypothetical protein